MGPTSYFSFVYRARWCQLCSACAALVRQNWALFLLLISSECTLLLASCAENRDGLQAEEAPSKQLEFIHAWHTTVGEGAGCWDSILSAASSVLSASQHKVRLRSDCGLRLATASRQYFLLGRLTAAGAASGPGCAAVLAQAGILQDPGG